MIDSFRYRTNDHVDVSRARARAHADANAADAAERIRKEEEDDDDDDDGVVALGTRRVGVGGVRGGEEKRERREKARF